MSTDISDTATTLEEVAVGAAEAAAEVAFNPVGAARKQVRNFERKGTPAVRRINRRISAMLPEKVTVFGLQVDDRLPEKLAIRGLHAVRDQARRQDMLGGVAKRTLKIFNGSFKTLARTATRLEEASQLTAKRESTTPKPARKRSRASRRRAA
jgi:hypothetical protein